MEDRIRNLERRADQQSYVLWILMVAFAFDTAGLLILWGERGPPQFDHIAVSLTVFQTLFGIAALFGFWSLRGATREKAEETTIAEVAKIAPPVIRREVQDILQTFRSETPISETDLAAMVAAVGDEKEGGNGQ